MVNPFALGGRVPKEPVERGDDGKILAASFNAPRPITSSAERINIGDKKELESLKKKREGADKWQIQAWAYSELIGEVRYAANLVGNLTSRIRLYPGYVTDEDLAPADIQDIDDKGVSDELKADARRALRLLASGNGGIPGLLRDASVNLFITGECYLLQRTKKGEGSVRGTFGQEVWEVRSVDEVKIESGRNAGTFVSGRRNAPRDTWEKVEGNFLGRIWHSYPRYSDEADSSLRPILELMDELLMMNKNVRSTIKSQMNGGILFIPDALSNIADSDGVDEDGNPIESDEDSIEEDLLMSMTSPISDEGAASSIYPLILRGPQDVGKDIRHIPLAKDLSKEMQERADSVLDRILAGIDIPKDVVSGLGSAKYSNAMVIEETMYKSHIEPLALLIVDSLTTVFLHPVLRAMGYSEEEIERVVIWYDPSAIAAKPSKADAANDGYDKKTISAQAWRREHGFTESDAPTQLEIGQRIAMERGLLDEQTSAALFETIIPDIFQMIRERNVEASPDGGALDAVLNGEMVPSADDPGALENLMDPQGQVPTEEDDEDYDAPPGLIEP